MTTDEVKQLIDAEIYENTTGHITGTLLSSILHKMNEKRISFADIATSHDEKQMFVSAFASALNPTVASRAYSDAQSALQSAILERLTFDIKGNFANVGPGYGDEREFISAVMNRMGYEYSPTFHNMFRSAVVSAINDRLHVDHDFDGCILLASAIVEIFNGAGHDIGLKSAYFGYVLGQNDYLVTQVAYHSVFQYALLNNQTFISQLRSALGI